MEGADSQSIGIVFGLVSGVSIGLIISDVAQFGIESGSIRIKFGHLIFFRRSVVSFTDYDS